MSLIHGRSDSRGRCVIKKRDRDRRADGLIGGISNPPSLLFFPLVSIGRNASGRATPTAEHDYVLTCIPAIARSHARYPLRNTPLSAEISWIVNTYCRDWSRLRPSAVQPACSGDANTSGPREDLSRFLVSTLPARWFEQNWRYSSEIVPSGF